jgi:alkylation response protein AidB-like acyl-CoA dehydrogenase
MDLRLTDEQQALQSSARALLERVWRPADVRRTRRPSGSGHDPALWETMASLGWLGLPFDVRIGGGGGTLLDLAVIRHEAGRALVPTTLASTLEAAVLIDRAGGELGSAVLPSVVAGHRLLTVAVRDDDVGGTNVTAATLDGDDVVVAGSKTFVPNAATADDLVVAARLAGGSDGRLALVLVPRTADGVSVEPLATSAGDAQDIVRFEGVRVPRSRLLTDDGHAALARTDRDATALHAIDAVGGVRAVLDMTVEYVTQRSQFGRPVGSFQAVQHHVADMATAVDAAGLVAWQAVWACERDDPGAARAVAIAAVAAADAYLAATLTAHQLHGGIGFATEHGLHLWSDRALAAAVGRQSRHEHLRTIAAERARTMCCSAENVVPPAD